MGEGSVSMRLGGIGWCRGDVLGLTGGLVQRSVGAEMGSSSASKSIASLGGPMEDLMALYVLSLSSLVRSAVYDGCRGEWPLMRCEGLALGRGDAGVPLGISSIFSFLLGEKLHFTITDFTTAKIVCQPLDRCFLKNNLMVPLPNYARIKIRLKTD